MATQAERTASARRRLLDAASTLVAEQGIGNTSVAEIGRAAGMSRGAVNFHFGSKDELLTAVTEQVVSTWIERIEAATIPPEIPLAAYIHAIVDTHITRIQQDPVTSRLMMVLLFESLGPAPHLLPMITRLFQTIHRVAYEQMSILQDQGKIRPDIDLDAFVTFLLGSLRGLALLGLLDARIEEQRAPYDQLAKSTIAHLAP